MCEICFKIVSSGFLNVFIFVTGKAPASPYEYGSFGELGADICY